MRDLIRDAPLRDKEQRKKPGFEPTTSLSWDVCFREIFQEPLNPGFEPASVSLCWGKRTAFITAFKILGFFFIFVTRNKNVKDFCHFFVFTLWIFFVFISLRLKNVDWPSNKSLFILQNKSSLKQQYTLNALNAPSRIKIRTVAKPETAQIGIPSTCTVDGLTNTTYHKRKKW